MGEHPLCGKCGLHQSAHIAPKKGEPGFIPLKTILQENRDNTAKMVWTAGSGQTSAGHSTAARYNGGKWTDLSRAEQDNPKVPSRQASTWPSVLLDKLYERSSSNPARVLTQAFKKADLRMSGGIPKEAFVAVLDTFGVILREWELEGIAEMYTDSEWGINYARFVKEFADSAQRNTFSMNSSGKNHLFLLLSLLALN
jgi:hypothetical protein